MVATPYPTVTISGYNDTPPADDGTAVASNQLNWSKHKTKLGDPLKTAIETIDSNLITAFVSVSHVVTNISSMTEIPKGDIPSNQLLVLGYATANDGGGGVFTWDSTSIAAANSGTIFEQDGAGTGRWIRTRPPKTIDFAWWNPDLTGATDEGAGLIEAAALLTSGDKFITPPGTLLCESTVTDPGTTAVTSMLFY